MTITRSQAADLLSINIKTLDEIIDQGKLKILRPTGKRCIRLIKSDVEDFIRSCSEVIINENIDKNGDCLK